MTEKVAKREGLGDILADGVKKAAEKIGKGAEKYAVHVGGQEPGMHDPRLPRGNGYPMSAARYQMDATPDAICSVLAHSLFSGIVLI